MNVEQIDKALADWDAKVASATSNLVDLQDLLTYKWLTGTGGIPKAMLTGVSQSKAAIAVSAVNQVWEYMNLLQEVLKQAHDLRQTVKGGIFSRDGAILLQIQALLEGNSINLGAIPTPLEQRTLFSATESAQKTTPEILLRRMTEGFQTAKDIILAIDKARNQMQSALDLAEKQVASLKGQADLIGGTAPRELSDAQDKISKLKASVLSDPLTVDADFSRELTPLLQRLGNRLDKLSQDKLFVTAEIIRARALLQGLQGVHVDAQRVADLDQQLKALEGYAQAGAWEEARTGLQKWFTAASARPASPPVPPPAQHTTTTAPPTQPHHQPAPPPPTYKRPEPENPVLDALITGPGLPGDSTVQPPAERQEAPADPALEALLNTPAPPAKPAENQGTPAGSRLDTLITGNGTSKPAATPTPHVPAADSRVEKVVQPPAPSQTDPLATLITGERPAAPAQVSKPSGGGHTTTGAATDDAEKARLEALLGSGGKPAASTEKPAPKPAAGNEKPAAKPAAPPTEKKDGKSLEDLFGKS